VKLLFFILIFSFLLSPIYSQQLNYRKVFGEDWLRAVTFEKENRSWMEPVLARYNISYRMAIAVIFPELVRYSALRDKMEITLLKALYINLGDEYADFSIGQFQMKPSFAELILEETSPKMNKNPPLELKSRSHFDDLVSYRKAIVSDLENTRSQFNYIIAFFKICDKKFNTERKGELQKLKFIATAYNYGIDKTAAQIDTMIDKKFFNTKLFKTENYSYADVSMFWYQEFNYDK